MKRKSADNRLIAQLLPQKRARRQTSFTKELSAWCVGTRKTLSKAFVDEAARTQRSALVVYRGLCLSAGHALLKHKVGDSIVLHQPTPRPSSWSTDRAIAHGFACVGAA